MDSGRIFFFLNSLTSIIKLLSIINSNGSLCLTKLLTATKLDFQGYLGGKMAKEDMWFVREQNDEPNERVGWMLSSIFLNSEFLEII